MSSGFPGDFFYGGAGGGGAGGNGIGRVNQGGIPVGFRQQFQPQQQQQGLILQDQIAQRRADLLMGKRSFGDYQSYSQQILLQQQQQQLQQQQQVLSYYQKQSQQQQQQQQQSAESLPILMQQQYLRSVKQRTHNFSSSPISPLSPTIDLCSATNNNNNNNMLTHNSSTRFGVPVYQQPRQIPLINNNPTNNSFIPSLTTNNNIHHSPINPAQSAGFSGVTYSKKDPIGSDPFGFSAPVPNPVPEEDRKMLNTLQALEKELLNDDDGDDYNNDQEGDAVSGITNSEWSETFQNLMSTKPSPNPNPTQVSTASTSGSNSNTTTNSNTNNNSNNMISPSPTTSTSSCCSTSASASNSPPTMTTTTVTTAVTASAKQLISEAATAISEGRTESLMEALSKLSQIADVKGTSEQRLAFYMGNALRCRACPNEDPAPVMELYGKHQMGSIYSLYDISPCFKFGLLAANLVMLDAINTGLQEGCKVHVIDFDIGHGGQYINLLRALSERRSNVGIVSSEMKVTVVETTELGGGEGVGVVEGVRDGLVKLGEKVGINLKFEVLTRAIHELTPESLGCEEGEAIVVNFAFKLYRVPDESVSMENLRDELLRRVKVLSPRAVTLVEQDMNGNTAPLMTRVNECCGYYGALFDSLESTLTRDNLDRVLVEEGLGRKMANSVACEGRDRVERAEVFGKWRARMGMAGFELKPLSQSVAESMRAKLNSARGGNPGFTVKEDNGGVGFGWMGRTLTVASAWR